MTFPLALVAAMAVGPPVYGPPARRPRTQELTERDREKIAKAKAKRERRAAKRLAGVKR